MEPYIATMCIEKKIYNSSRIDKNSRNLFRIQTISTAIFSYNKKQGKDWGRKND